MDYNKENLQQIKQQIFPRYMGQKVLWVGNSVVQLDKSWNWKHESFRLKLKPLSSITDEDIYTVAKMQGFINNNDFSIYFANGQFKWDDGNTWGQFLASTLYPESFQYLQLKGYALSQLVIIEGKTVNLSVEQQVELGIIELIK